MKLSKRANDDALFKLKLSAKLANLLQGISVPDMNHLFERLYERSTPDQLDDIMHSLEILTKKLRKKDPPNKGPWFWKSKHGKFFGTGTSLETYISNDMDQIVSREQQEQNWKLSHYKFALAYQGNLGFEEMMEFYKLAPPELQRLLEFLLDKNYIQEAMTLLQNFLNVKLKPL